MASKKDAWTIILKITRINNNRSKSNKIKVMDKMNKCFHLACHLLGILRSPCLKARVRKVMLLRKKNNSKRKKSQKKWFHKIVCLIQKENFLFRLKQKRIVTQTLKVAKKEARTEIPSMTALSSNVTKSSMISGLVERT